MRYRTVGIVLALVGSISLCAADDGAASPPLPSAYSSLSVTQPPVSVSAPAPSGASFLRMCGGLLFCLGVFGAGMHISRRYGIGQNRGGKRRMRVIEKLPISQKSSLLLVSCDGREILLSVGPDQARVLQAQLPLAREQFEESFADMYSVQSEEKQCVG